MASNLIPVLRLVVRDGKAHYQKYYVSPKEAVKEPNPKKFESPEQFKLFCKELTTEQRREIMKRAEELGISWKRQTVPQTDWMRCAMAINAHLKSGGTFELKPFSSQEKQNPSNPSLPKADKTAVITAESIFGKTFSNRTEFKAFTKKITTEQRREIMKDAEKQGVVWTRVTTSPGTDWMRCAMAIGSILDSGKPYTIGGGTPKSNLTPDQAEAPSVTGSSKPNTAPAVVPVSEENNNRSDANGSTSESREPVQVQQPPTSKIEELFNKLNLPFKEENGAIVVGEGRKTIKNKWGKPEIAPDCIKLVNIGQKSDLGPGNWIKLESNFLDKDKVKGMGARWGGVVNPYDKSWYIPFADFLKILKTFKNIEIPKEIAPTIKAVMERVPDVQALIDNRVQQLQQNQKVVNDVDISDFKMPEGINQKLNLYDHQKKGVKFAIQNKGVILGLAVGLGKTLTSIVAGKELINQGEVKRIVAITPASVKFNWKNEVEGFSDMKATVLESSDLSNPKKAEEAWKRAEESQVVIVNFDMIRKPEIRDKLKELAPDCVIVDEAHKLKNQSKQTQGFLKAWKTAKYKWFLTATPFPNGKPRETYNMLHHIRPDLVGSWTGGKDSFGSKFVVWQKGAFGSTPVALKNMDKLQELMKDVVFIRTHKSPDVTSALPKERHTTFNLEMEPAQAKLYWKVAKQVRQEIDVLEKQGIQASSPVVLSRMIKLEQIAIDPDMLQSDPSKIDMNKLYPKEEWAVNTILDHLENPENRGVVLFCDMKLPLEKIKQGLVNNKVDPSKIAFITGDVKPAERTAIQDKMKTGEVKVVLCTNAAEEGVNLQHGAHTLIHLDVPWVPKSITQREGRILRQGQTSEYAQFLTPILQGTVEDVKRGKLGLKVSTIEALLGEDSTGSVRGNIESSKSAESLTLRDIKEMLSGRGA